MPALSAPVRVGLLALVLVCGFWLRLTLHDHHGLEGDDGFSLSLARLDTGELLRGLAALELDIHPPLHFLALKGWVAAGGESLLSLRLMNILADVLTGALLMRIAGRAWSSRAALLAGLLWLVSPLLIYSTYLIRMYSLLALFAAGGAACVIEGRFQRRREVWFAGAVLCGLLAAYTHIVGALIACALALAVLVDWLADQRRSIQVIGIGGAAFVIAGLLYLPYGGAVWTLYRSGRTLGAEISEAQFVEPLGALVSTITTTLTHRALSDVLGEALLTALLVVGSVGLWRRHSRHILPLLLIAWVGLAGMAALAWIAGFYKARYLTPFAPPLLALIAAIILLPDKRWRVLGSIGVIGLMAWGTLKDLDYSFRDDWAAAANFIEAHERAGDRVVVIPEWGQEAFKFHYRGSAEVMGLFPGVSEDINYASVLEVQIEGAERVWYVSYQPDISDPAQLANRWFRERAATITEVFPAGMHIYYYDFRPEQSALPADAQVLDAQFGDALRLRGVYLPVTAGRAGDQRLHPPSNWVQVILYWEALKTNLDVTPRVRLTDPYAQVYGAALERDNDVLHRAPVISWQPGIIWQVAYDLNLNPQTPPGKYNIEVMVLNASGQPLPTTGMDTGEYWMIAGQFTVK
jgi:hypothetical protein